MSTAAANEPLHAEDLQRFFTLSVDLMCIIGTNGYFKYLSPGWEKQLGFTEAELMADSFLSFIHPEDRDPSATVVGTLGDGVVLEAFRNRYRTKEGTYRWLEWKGVKAPDVPLLYAVARDVTERIEIEAARRASEERLNSLLRTSRVVLYSSMPTRNCATTFISENVEEQLGYEPRYFVDDPGFWLERVHPDDVDRVLAALADLSTEKAFTHEYRFLHMDGCYRWVRDECKLVRDADGEPLEIVGAWQDITQQREAEEMIRAQAVALEELSTPLIPVSEHVLVMPLIGIMDTRRASQVIEALLNGVTKNRATAAILDVTGVSVVDAQVANALMSAAKAVRLLGARAILTGVRPEVARTLVGIGVDLQDITTCATLRDGIALAVSEGSALF